MVAAHDVAVGLMVAGDLVDDVAGELDEVDEAGEEELDGVDLVGVVHDWLRGQLSDGLVVMWSAQSVKRS